MAVCLERLFQESERERREQESQQSQQAAQVAAGKDAGLQPLDVLLSLFHGRSESDCRSSGLRGRTSLWTGF